MARVHVLGLQKDGVRLASVWLRMLSCSKAPSAAGNRVRESVNGGMQHDGACFLDTAPLVGFGIILLLHVFHVDVLFGMS